MPSIENLKENQLLETPLLLFECVLRNGEIHRWATHSIQHEGQSYAARIIRHTPLESRSLSDSGIDAISRVTITLANADSYPSQIERSIGWKGAQLTVRFLFFDLTAGAAASDSVVVFRGVANAPDELSEAECRLTFASRLSLQRLLLPEIRIQRRCPWTFPTTSAQREEAIHGGEKGRYGPFFRCGYSADQSGGTGNLNGGSPFTSCDGSRSSCEQRGMFDEDEAGRGTRRFGGIEFVPETILVRSFGEKGAHYSGAVENQARYNDFVPIVYGTAWYEPPIVFGRNDGNLTRLELLLGIGEIEDVLTVVVNNVEIPEGKTGAEMTGTGWFNLVSRGNRTGNFNLDFSDSGGTPLGDPYGSMAYLSVVVPNHVNNGGTLPRVQVLLKGLRLETFHPDGSFNATEFTNNPAWIVLDLLRRCGWRPSELDLPSFSATAQHCDELISTEDLNGNAVSIPRYQCNLVVRRRRSAADLVRGVREGSGLYLTYGYGGLLHLKAASNFAVQHPTKAAGSNSEQEFNSGWPAYEFGDGSILRKADGAPAIRFWSKPTSDTSNRLSVEFQDEWNGYQQDSLSLVDVDDVLQSGQEVTSRLPALGIANFSQAARILRRTLDREIRGNLFVALETSVRAMGVQPGDLITLTYLKEGFTRQPFRVTRVAAGNNSGTINITGQLHDDTWYADMLHAGGSAGRSRGGEIGVPRPLLGTVADEDGKLQFGIVENKNELSDGSMKIALTVSFVVPRHPGRGFSGVPLVSLAAGVDTSGGSLPGNRLYYYAVSAFDAGGEESETSFIVRAATAALTDANRVTLTGLSFPKEATSFGVYRGDNPSQLCRIASHMPIAQQFIDDGLPCLDAGPPDSNYDHARLYWRLERVPEYPVTASSPNSIAAENLQMIDNEHTGAVVRVTRGRGAGQERVISGNDAQTLMIEGHWEVQPDASSSFVVSEASWHLGASGRSSPLEFEVPNHHGATVHISGRSTNALGRESPLELSPLTRWVIGGASGSQLDIDVPDQPVFGLNRTGQGTVEVVGVGFGDFTNTRSIDAGTLSVHYWDELSSGDVPALASGIAAGDTSIDLDGPGSAVVGGLVQVGSEILVVEAVLNGGLQYDVSRGSFGTAAEALTAGEPVYHLERKTFVVPFVRDFFGSPASGSFSYPIFLPDVRIAAAELFVTNSRGNSESARNAFTATVDRGLRTLSGGQLSIQVDGFLAIESNAAPPLVIEDSHSVRDVFAVVQAAPTGAPVDIELHVDNQLYCSLTIPSGQKSSNVVDGFNLPPLREKAEMTLHIVSVGQAFDTTTGRDLTVTIRL